jgi:hypothetical protein
MVLNNISTSKPTQIQADYVLPTEQVRWKQGTKGNVVKINQRRSLCANHWKYPDVLVYKENHFIWPVMY